MTWLAGRNSAATAGHSGSGSSIDSLSFFPPSTHIAFPSTQVHAQRPHTSLPRLSSGSATLSFCPLPDATRPVVQSCHSRSRRPAQFRHHRLSQVPRPSSPGSSPPFQLLPGPSRVISPALLVRPYTHPLHLHLSHSRPSVLFLYSLLPHCLFAFVKAFFLLEACIFSLSLSLSLYKLSPSLRSGRYNPSPPPTSPLRDTSRGLLQAHFRHRRLTHSDARQSRERRFFYQNDCLASSALTPRLAPILRCSSSQFTCVASRR